MVMHIFVFVPYDLILSNKPGPMGWSLPTHGTVAMVTIGFVSTLSEPQTIEQGISNVEVLPS